MNTLSKLSEALTQVQNGMNGLPGLLTAEWRQSAEIVKQASTVLHANTGAFIQYLHKVLASYSGLSISPESRIRGELQQLRAHIKTADASAHEVKVAAMKLSARIQPLIGHLDLLKQRLAGEVDAARAAKIETDLDVEELEYKIKHAGQFVSPFFRPGQPATRQAVMFPTDVSSVTKRLQALVPLKAQADARAKTLADRLGLLNATNANLDNLTRTDELMNSCRTAIVRLDGDLESALAKEQQILDARNETLTRFYTRQLANPITDIQKMLG